jgi:hypothetical protein
MPNKLLTLSEAAALVERRRGKKVHRTTVKAWGLGRRFKLYNVNGWKVEEAEFRAWAARTGRLKAGV